VFLGVFPVFGGVLWCYRAHVLHLPVQVEPATMLLVFERFLQQSWHIIIQPSSLWLAPRVLMSVPVLPHSVHVPMLFGLWGGWLLRSPRVGLCYLNLEKYI